MARARQTMVLCFETAVFGMQRRVCHLGHDRVEVTVGGGGFTATAFAGAFMIAGTLARPRGRVFVRGSLRWASSASTVTSFSPAISASIILCPDIPSTSLATEPSLMLARLQQLLDAVVDRVALLHQLLALRDKTRLEQSTLQPLRYPLRVLHVDLSPRHLRGEKY